MLTDVRCYIDNQISSGVFGVNISEKKNTYPGNQQMQNFFIINKKKVPPLIPFKRLKIDAAFKAK